MNHVRPVSQGIVYGKRCGISEGVERVIQRASCDQPAQKPSTPLSSACTLANPRTAAALARPLYRLARAAILWLKQFGFPGLPANVGADWIKRPNASGLVPTGIVAVTVLLAVSITETLFEPKFAA